MPPPPPPASPLSLSTLLVLPAPDSVVGVHAASSLEETGYLELLRLMDVIRQAGQDVIVVDSDDLQVGRPCCPTRLAAATDLLACHPACLPRLSVDGAAGPGGHPHGPVWTTGHPLPARAAQLDCRPQGSFVVLTDSSVGASS